MVTPTKKATTMGVKMEMAMDERININRHQMAQEKTITETKEIIVRPIIRGSYSNFLYCTRMIK